MNIGIRWLCVLALAMLSQPTSAQTEPSTSQESSTQVPANDIEQLAGPNGVAQELAVHTELRESFAQPGRLDSWFDWKARLVQDHDVSLGLRAWFLAQTASNTLADSDNAVGAIYRFQGSWEAFSGESAEVGRLSWRVEYRSGVAGALAPADLAGDAGIATLNTGFGYSGNFSADVSVFSWSQAFANRRFGFVVGRLAPDVYSDAFVFSTFSRGYLNRASLFNPTQGTTGVGALGIVAKGFVNEQLWLGAHLYDANAVNGEFDLDTFRQHEWLKEVEIGWAPSFARRPTDRIQFLYWSMDERVAAGISSGKGWVMTASASVLENVIGFVRLGASDGGAGVPAERAVSAGVEYSRGIKSAWALGLGWARPSTDTYGTGLDDELAVELSYRYQFNEIISLTPDVQVVLNPALDPSRSSVWVVGLRFAIAI